MWQFAAIWQHWNTELEAYCFLLFHPELAVLAYPRGVHEATWQSAYTRNQPSRTESPFGPKLLICHAYIRTYTYTHTCASIHTYIYIYIHTHTHTCKYTYIYVYMYMCFAFVLTSQKSIPPSRPSTPHACMRAICIYIYIHIHTHTHSLSLSVAALEGAVGLRRTHCETAAMATAACCELQLLNSQTAPSSQATDKHPVIAAAGKIADGFRMLQGTRDHG